jgi:hypothetical protein
MFWAKTFFIQIGRRCVFEFVTPLFKIARFLMVIAAGAAVYFGILEAQKYFTKGGDWVGDIRTKCYYEKSFVDTQNRLYALSARGDFIPEAKKNYFHSPSEARSRGFRPCKML